MVHVFIKVHHTTMRSSYTNINIVIDEKTTCKINVGVEGIICAGKKDNCW